MPGFKQTLASLVGVFSSSRARPPKVVDPTRVRPASYTLWNTQLRPLPPTASGREYQVYVGLPYSYNREPNRRYPVVYMCDGYWYFPLLNALYSGLVYDRVVPEYLIIGLGYGGENPDYDRLRLRDLSPVRATLFGPSGQAAAFLKVLQGEIIPFVDREYRTDKSTRMLAGASLGGLFTLYTMFTEPGLFRGGIAISPSVTLGNDWLFAYEAAFARAGRALDARLFMTCGACEYPSYVAGIRRFDQQLAERRYPGLAREFRLIDGERHSSTAAEALNRGLRFVFEPIAPETGPQRE